MTLIFFDSNPTPLPIHRRDGDNNGDDDDDDDGAKSDESGGSFTLRRPPPQPVESAIFLPSFLQLLRLKLKSRYRYVKKSQRIGGVILCCLLQRGMTQPIPQLFWHICVHIGGLRGKDAMMKRESNNRKLHVFFTLDKVDHFCFQNESGHNSQCYWCVSVTLTTDWGNFISMLTQR